MTAAEYLAWEAEQLERHEFFQGNVYAMAGGTPRHNALSAAVTIELGARHAVRVARLRVPGFVLVRAGDGIAEGMIDG